MGYCFMSVGKVSDFKTMEGKYKHNYRLYDVQNADPSKAHLNEELISLNGKSYKTAYDEKIAELQSKGLIKSVRRNAVYGIEVVLTFSREEFENVDIEKWKADNVEWMNRTFNESSDVIQTDNVVSMVYHGDESGNVHIHAFVIPIDEKGHLNARHYTDGPSKMRELQDSYGEMMKRNHNLNRGLKNSIASHKDIKKFYTALNQAVETRLPDINKNETIADYKKRADECFQQTNMQHLDEMNKMQRKIDELKTISLNERYEFEQQRKQVKKSEHQLDRIISYCGTSDMRQLRDIVQEDELTKAALANYPDRSLADDTLEKLNLIKEYESKRRKKEQQHQKNKLEQNI